MCCDGNAKYLNGANSNTCIASKSHQVSFFIRLINLDQQLVPESIILFKFSKTKIYSSTEMWPNII